jgi:hypothetical protein
VSCFFPLLEIGTNALFVAGGVLTTTAFPCDLDTTSIALTIAPHFTNEVKQDVMNEIVKMKNNDDLVQTYFDTTRPRIGELVSLCH